MNAAYEIKSKEDALQILGAAGAFANAVVKAMKSLPKKEEDLLRSSGFIPQDETLESTQAMISKRDKLLGELEDTITLAAVASEGTNKSAQSIEAIVREIEQKTAQKEPGQN